VANDRPALVGAGVKQVPGTGPRDQGGMSAGTGTRRAPQLRLLRLGRLQVPAVQTSSSGTAPPAVFPERVHGCSKHGSIRSRVGSAHPGYGAKFVFTFRLCRGRCGPSSPRQGRLREQCPALPASRCVNSPVWPSGRPIHRTSTARGQAPWIIQRRVNDPSTACGDADLGT
jgi:hypothetical protein